MPYSTEFAALKTLDVQAAPSKPNLCAVAIVANECDIIESFARHTLSFADHLHVLLHNSCDSTRRILECLASEGLPVSLDVAATVAYTRERMGDDLVHRIADGGHYDYLLPLDADEFIVAGSRAELEAELNLVPDGWTLSLDWLPYVPTESDDVADPNPLTRIRHRLRTPHSRLRKVFFAATLLAREDVYLADGNHKLLSRTSREIPERTTSRVALAHYPVRSAQQLASKVCIGSMARRLSADYTDNQSPHWRSMMADPSLTTDTPIGLLSRISMGYLGCADADLVDAPLATTARNLKYVELIRVNAFERLSAFVAATFMERAAGDRADSSDMISRQKLLKELEEARLITQHLHESVRAVAQTAQTSIRAVKQKARMRVRAAKRKARIWTIAAICCTFLVTVVAMAYVYARLQS